MIEPDTWDGTERRSQARWHVGKEVPLAVLFALVVQTVGGIWWLAQLSVKIDNAIATLSEFRIERYTREDARRDRELLITLLDQVKQADREHDRRISALEGARERAR